jgi:hypothetical protein
MAPSEYFFGKRAKPVLGSSLCCTTVVLAFLLRNATPAFANPVSHTVQARDHFDRGLALVREGDLSAAIEEFEAAHRGSPHATVLYNLGQAYASTGRSLDAIRVLEAYLVEVGESASVQRRQAVAGLVARERSRLATIEVVASPFDTEIFVNGKIQSDRSSSSVVLDAGRHVILATHPGYVPRIVTLELAAGERRRVQLTLDVSPEPVVADGVLLVTCGMPGVTIEVDGHKRAVTPLEAPLVLAHGRRVVRLTRHGYAPSVQAITIQPSRTARINCNLNDSPDLLSSRGGLRVQVSEPGAVVMVDGKPYHGELLAPGLHALKVERDGFVEHQDVVVVSNGRFETVKVTLRPTQTTLRERQAAARSRRIWAVASGALGAALAGAAITTAVWNDRRYQDWKREREQFEEAVRRGLPSSDTLARGRALNSTATQIQRTDDIALGLGLAATGALATASILWFAEWLGSGGSRH